MTLRLSAAAIGMPNDSVPPEWLETNGLGGFASGTVMGLATRRYHGLLFGAMTPPTGRNLLMATLVEKLTVGAETVMLSMHRYRTSLQDSGRTYLVSFTLDPFPVWTYEIGDVEIEKSLFLPPGENAVVVQYRVLSNPRKEPLMLSLVPLYALRDLHALRREDPALSLAAQTRAGGCSVGHAGLQVHLSFNAAQTLVHEYWYRDVLLTEEQARGYDAVEDLWSSVELNFALTKKQPAYLVADVKKRTWSMDDVRTAERARRTAAATDTRNALRSALERAADQFIVRRGKKGTTIIAGYPWFTDWSRDTFISLPGLLLTRDRADAAKNIVKTFLTHLSKGMLPNRFPEAGSDPEYNTVDGTLWLFQAIRAIIDATDDVRFLRSVWPQLLDIIAWHERGTRHGICVDSEDGLLRQGDDRVALTWMDAVIDGDVITPRRGKAVEVNALWYNALRCMQEWSLRLKNDALGASFREKADHLRSNFRAAFWHAQKQYLYDCIDLQGHPVAEIRPNQIFAISLRDDLLTKEQQHGVLATVSEHLLTPVGLRSLSPGDPHYCGRYEGNPRARDSAYHQGTVWGWLLGPYIDAYLTVHRRSADVKRDCKLLLGGMRQQLTVAGIGTLSEIFDGDAPHTPRGCIAQAWTVAEVLRVVREL